MKLLPFFAAIALSVSATTAEDILGDCATGPWQKSIQVIGGDDGGQFCETRWTYGALITGLEVWTGTDHIKGLQFKYSTNEYSQIYGNADDKSGRFEWDPVKDPIEIVRLWGDGYGSRLGRIYMRTRSQREFDFGKDTTGQKQYELDVGSGILAGAFGASGNDIDRLGLLFFGSPIKSITMGDVVLDKSADQAALEGGLQSINLDNVTFRNEDTDNTVDYTFKREEKKSASTTVTKTNQWMVGTEVGFQFTVEVPLIASTSINGKLQFQYTRIEANAETTTNDQTLSWWTTSKVAPGQSVHCEAWAAMGDYESDYSSKVTIWFQDGNNFSLNERGHIKSVSWSQAWAFCREPQPGDPGVSARALTERRSTPEASLVPTPEPLPRRAIRGQLGSRMV